MGDWTDYVPSWYQEPTQKEREIIEINYSRRWVKQKNFLRNAHTRQLMEWLRKSRVTGFYCPRFDIELKTEDIKVELSKREHVPSKEESRQSRKERIRTRNPRGRGDR